MSFGRSLAFVVKVLLYQSEHVSVGRLVGLDVFQQTENQIEALAGQSNAVRLMKKRLAFWSDRYIPIRCLDVIAADEFEERREIQVKLITVETIEECPKRAAGKLWIDGRLDLCLGRRRIHRRFPVAIKAQAAEQNAILPIDSYNFASRFRSREVS